SDSHGFLPASSASVTLADAILPLTLTSQLLGHGRYGPGGQLPCGRRRVVLGRHTTSTMELKLVLLWCRTAGGTGVSYAGPDRSETLP
ncbi:hypothetical protein AQJ23_12905, partial [Streptomyces antibioticus]